MREPTSRRVFLTEGAAKYQILSFTQRPDASFYVSCPDFARSGWLEISEGPGPKTVNFAAAPGEGKLSIHATGFAGIRVHETTGHHVTIHGNQLMDASKKVVSVRHLLSVFPREPYHLTDGPRVSDYTLTAKRMKPAAFIFFAVPSGLEVHMQLGFHIDDIGEPPDISFGMMTFPIHAVVWLAYSTKGMLEWPPNTQFCHYDGHDVPLFTGFADRTVKFAAARPQYRLDDQKLSVTLMAIGPDESPLS